MLPFLIQPLATYGRALILLSGQKYPKATGVKKSLVHVVIY
jgi:hypothetical protein